LPSHPLCLFLPSILPFYPPTCHTPPPFHPSSNLPFVPYQFPLNGRGHCTAHHGVRRVCLCREKGYASPGLIRMSIRPMSIFCGAQGCPSWPVRGAEPRHNARPRRHRATPSPWKSRGEIVLEKSSVIARFAAGNCSRNFHRRKVPSWSRAPRADDHHPSPDYLGVLSTTAEPALSHRRAFTNNFSQECALRRPRVVHHRGGRYRHRVFAIAQQIHALPARGSPLINNWRNFDQRRHFENVAPSDRRSSGFINLITSHGPVDRQTATDPTSRCCSM